MKYLFVDCEFATCKRGIPKICEFGYVLTNEQFHIIKKDNLIIDPGIRRYEWDYYAVKKILKRTIKEYEKYPSFDHYYEEIIQLIHSADYIFGHAIESDVAAINGDIYRYHLPEITFNIIDNKLLYKGYNHNSQDVGVETILNEFNVPLKGDQHDASDDAFNTMKGLKAMLSNYHVTLKEFIELCPDAVITSTKYATKKIIKANKRKEAKRQKAKLMNASKEA